MRDTAVPAAGPFATHHVDLTASGALARVAARVSAAGLVTVSGLTTRAAVLDFAAQVMTVTPHRDSGADGLTAIFNTGRHEKIPGARGLTSSELALHTEGSQQTHPPRLMLLVCTHPATRGGQVRLVDGRAVFADLEQYPDAVAALSSPRACFFGGSGGLFAPVFARQPGGRVSVRLRQDELARWNPLAQIHLHLLRKTMDKHEQVLTLRAGQGYLLDNERFLHARTAFEGSRRCYRALGDPRWAASPGFTPKSLLLGGAA